MQTIDIKGLAATNPKVDSAKVQEALDTIRELQRRGVARARYNLASPYSRAALPSPTARARDKVSAKIKGR